MESETNSTINKTNPSLDGNGEIILLSSEDDHQTSSDDNNDNNNEDDNDETNDPSNQPERKPILEKDKKEIIEIMDDLADVFKISNEDVRGLFLKPSNELNRMAFIGDAILELHIRSRLLERSSSARIPSTTIYVKNSTLYHFMVFHGNKYKSWLEKQNVHFVGTLFEYCLQVSKFQIEVVDYYMSWVDKHREIVNAPAKRGKKERKEERKRLNPSKKLKFKKGKKIAKVEEKPKLSLEELSKREREGFIPVPMIDTPLEKIKQPRYFSNVDTTRTPLTTTQDIIHIDSDNENQNQNQIQADSKFVVEMEQFRYTKESPRKRYTHVLNTKTRISPPQKQTVKNRHDNEVKTKKEIMIDLIDDDVVEQSKGVIFLD